MEKQFRDAARYGKDEEVRKILKENPTLNVNWSDPDSSNQTALIQACRNGHDKVVTLLLAHPDIDINQKDYYGESPFFWACVNGSTSCVQLLLKDGRVKVNEPNRNGSTPLYWAAPYGHLEVIKWWIASGREVDLGQPGNEINDAIGGAKESGKTEVISLLEKFKVNPDQTRNEIRKELLWFGEEAEFFALVIFLSDGLLEIKVETSGEAARFFRMARKVPMELQVVLCYRVVGSMRMNIPGEEREAAFKQLARQLLSSS
jgi:hypothetical protein